MKKIDKETRKIFAEKIIDLANLIFISLVISQFVPERKVNPILTFTGIMFLFLGYLLGFILVKGGAK